MPWERFVPQWEDGFSDPEGPSTVAEAIELYRDTVAGVGAFAAREIAPHARAVDREGATFADGEVVLPAAVTRNVQALARMGVLAPSLPRAVGGANMPFSAGTAIFEILARACTNTLLLYAFHQGPAALILRGGSKDQVDRWVRRLATGEISGAVAMTEPEAGSDVGNLSTAAVAEGARWRLRGRKQFITNGGADVCIVLARSEAGSKGLDGLSLLVAPRRENGRDNYAVAPPEKKQVIRGSATCELSFDGACAEMLGAPGSGFGQILTFMNEARLAVAAQGLGIAEAAFRAARSYAERRVQMGRAIARHELVADLLLDMETEIAALRALLFRCAALLDERLGLERSGQGGSPEALALARELRERVPLVKWFGAERALWVTRAAVQVHGGYGVMEDYDVERHYRDALILPIYEGTSQIQALMSLKDQARWSLARPVAFLGGGSLRVSADADTLGDGVRDMADEYSRALRSALTRSVGWAGLLGAVARRRGPESEGLDYARLQAERLCAMLAYTRAAEALAGHAPLSDRHRRLAERFVSRSLPLVRMHGVIVRSGDRSTLEAR